MWNNQKQQKIVFPYVKLTNLLSCIPDFQKVDQTRQGQLVAKPGTPLLNILVGNVNMT